MAQNGKRQEKKFTTPGEGSKLSWNAKEFSLYELNFPRRGCLFAAGAKANFAEAYDCQANYTAK